MILSEQDLTALWVTIKLASVSTLVLLIIGTPIAWWLSRSQWRFKFIIEAIIALPLILPPTVLGFYLLISHGGCHAVSGVLNLLLKRLLPYPLFYRPPCWAFIY